jgi:hypothetical protein
MMICLVCILILTFAAPSFAQQPDPRCVALNPADCTFFTQALDQMKTVGSFNNQTFSLRLGGSGGTSTGNEGSITGSGPMLVDETGKITALDLTVSGDLTGQGTPAEGRLIWIDDVLYVHAPDENGEMQWTGIPTSTEGGDLLMMLLNGTLWNTAFTAPGVAVIQRGADVEMNDRTMAVYTAQIDLITFLLTPEILSVLEGAMANAAEQGLMGSDTGGGTSPFGSGEFDIAGAIQLLPLLMSKDTVSAILWIGTDDQQVYHLEFLMDLALDATLIDPEIGEATFLFELKTDLDQHGQAFTIAAPETYTMADPSTFDLSGLSLDMLGGDTASEATNQPATPLPLDPIEGTLTYGEIVTGTLSEDNQQDIWGIEASAGDVITITLKATDPESSLDLRIFLQSPDGEQIASNDDHGTEREDLMIFDALLEHVEIPADGEYRILATWLIPDENGNYQLTVEKTN